MVQKRKNTLTLTHTHTISTIFLHAPEYITRVTVNSLSKVFRNYLVMLYQPLVLIPVV